jgi:hypothetical protein
VGIVLGFAPWIVYWILVGNVPFTTAVLVALAVAVLSFVIGRVKGKPGRTLEIGAVATFLVLTILTVALNGVLIGKPFVREFAEADQPKEVVESPLFAKITTLLTWIWVGAFAGMTVSSAIPPIVQGDATILDTKTPLSFVCYWVIPFSLLGLAALASRVLPEQMTPGDDVVRNTTFVAFAEMEIDQLIYLATEHANREVGAGKEPYDIRIGSKGVPLVGDDTRESWPSTYKVRDRKR